MHTAKFDRAGTKRIRAHVLRTRETVTKSEIDPKRTHLNASLMPPMPEAEMSKFEALAKRKDAVMLVDTVTTLPEELKYASRRKQLQFFEAVFEAQKEYLGGVPVFAEIHFDEATPHLHAGTIPITPDGRLCAKEFTSRAVLKNLHPAIEEAVRAKGFEVALYETNEELRIAQHASGDSKRSMDEYRKHMKAEGAREQYEQETDKYIEAYQNALKHSKKPLKRQKGESKEEFRERKKDLVQVQRSVYEGMMDFRLDVQAVEASVEAENRLSEASKKEEGIDSEIGEVRAYLGELRRDRANMERTIEERTRRGVQDQYRDWVNATNKGISKGLTQLMEDLDKSGSRAYAVKLLRENPDLVRFQKHFSPAEIGLSRGITHREERGI